MFHPLSYKHTIFSMSLTKNNKTARLNTNNQAVSDR